MSSPVNEPVNSPKDPFHVPWNILDCIYIGFFYILIQLLLPILFKGAHLNTHLFIGHISSLLVTWLYLRQRYTMRLIDVGIRLDWLYFYNAPKGIAIGLISFIIALIITFSFSPFFLQHLSNIKILTRNETYQVSADVFKNSGFLYFILIPFSEELFFRGLLFAALRKRFNMLNSILVNSLLFSAIHLATYHEVSRIFQMFLISIIYAWAYEKHKSILIPFIAHAVHNYFITYYFTLAHVATTMSNQS